MNCCGQKRRQWQTEGKPAHADPVKTEPIMQQPVNIYYSGSNNYFVKGRYTGILYLFAPANDGLLVDIRDVPSLLEDSQKLSKDPKERPVF